MADPETIVICGVELRLKPKLTQARLKEVLDYDPETGIFRWKIRPCANGLAEPGSVAGSVYSNKDKHQDHHYIVISINNRLYRAHRLAWMWMYGRWPVGEIDHIDLDGTNNRLANLVEVIGPEGQLIQKFNSRLRQNNTSGHTGVRLRTDNRHPKWRASIGARHNRYDLGSFETFEEAVAARQAAEIKLLGCLASELSDPRNRSPRPMPKPLWRRL